MLKKFGFDANKMLWNRILMRLEEDPKFDMHKKYTIIQVGDTYSLRKKYLKINYDNFSSEPGLLSHSYNLPRNHYRGYEFYYPTDFTKNNLWANGIKDSRYREALKKLNEVGVLQKAKAWPNKNSILINDDLILFVLDQDRLRQFVEIVEKVD